jgi:CheY-like chemotaxis protein
MAISASLARAFLPDVILMDINLPGMSGYGALKRAARRSADGGTFRCWRCRPTPCRATSKRASKRAFFRYLTKPIRVREFMEALDVALEHAAAGATAESPQKEFHA